MRPLATLAPRYETFVCDLCRVRRAVARRSAVQPITCEYCVEVDLNTSRQYKWCPKGNHEAVRSAFFIDNEEQEECSACRPPPPTDDGHDLHIGGPPFEAPADSATLAGPALNNSDWTRIKQFNAALNGMIMETCQRCRERWFEMKLKDGVCDRCFRADQRRSVDEPFLYSEGNRMDPGD